MRQAFRGRRWTVKVEAPANRAWGDTTYPDQKIRISPKAEGRLLLETLLHEGLHACLPDLTEEAVSGTEASLAEFLWRWGFRKVDTD